MHLLHHAGEIAGGIDLPHRFIVGLQRVLDGSRAFDGDDLSMAAAGGQTVVFIFSNAAMSGFEAQIVGCETVML